MPAPGKPCLKRARMWSRAGLLPAEAAMVGDGAGGPARASGESPAAHIAAAPRSSPAFWEARELCSGLRAAG